jgi:cytochrome d ubiquinol oxidase subunit II
MLDYETLKLIWWLLVGVLLLGFAIMDGHDMGVGTLLPFVGKNDTERRVVINTVGPHWDGNQVWFITGGGAIFAAWPLVYATAFSGFYWAMLAVLWALFFRPVGFDYRSKIRTRPGASTWDWGLFVGGAVPPLIFGVAFGNLLQGVPFHFDDNLVSYYTGSFWALLNPFALLAGVVSSTMITFHGANYLMHRTEGPVRARPAGRVLVRLAMVASFLLAGCSSAACPALSSPRWSTRRPARPAGQDRGRSRPAPGSATSAPCRRCGCCPPGYAGGLAGVALAARRPLGAFVASSLAMTGIIGTAGVALFPFVMPSSSDPRSSLTVWDSVSSHLTLELMFWATLIFMPLIIFYTSWAYKVMSGKVTEEFIVANDKAAY